MVLLTAIGLGWVVRRAGEQRAAVAEIRRLHGIFNYDWRIRIGRIARNATPPGPKWLRQLIGDEPFQEVISVVLAHHQTANQTVDDVTLAYLGGLKHLRMLLLDDTAVTDAGRKDLLRALPQLTFAVPRRPVRTAPARTKSLSDTRTSGARASEIPPGRKIAEPSRDIHAQP